MKKFATVALTTALVLVPFTGEAFADTGKGAGRRDVGGHNAEHGATLGKERPGRHKQTTHARGIEHAAPATDTRGKDEEMVASHAPEDGSKVKKVGICHATGTGSYVFVRVSENAHGHLEQHADDVEATGSDACPETPASLD